MALYNEKPVMIGSYDEPAHCNPDPNDRNNASYFEIFDPAINEWSDLNRNTFFPEEAKYYMQGASVTKEDSFLIFGGILRAQNSKSASF